MKIICRKALLLLCIGIQSIQTISLIKTPAIQHASERTFDQWYTACAKLPSLNKDFKHTALSEAEFTQIINAYKKQVTNDSTLTQSAYWLNAVPSTKELYSEICTPYAQKLIIKPEAKVAFHGDLHGDIHALNEFIRYLQANNYMQDFKVIQNDFYLIFLGDYTDRGYYGAEVWYTIMRLKLANPDRVYMVRGNHEDHMINDRYGFTTELQIKFSNKTACAQELYNLYNFLPVVLYLGSGTDTETNYLQCCHGGLELGFDPRPLFLDKRPTLKTLILQQNRLLDRGSILHQLSHANRSAIEQRIPYYHLNPIRVEQTYDIGFMWNDFIINTTGSVSFGPRGWECGKALTHDLLATLSTTNHKLRGVFRAHQHGDLDMMNRILNRDHKGHMHDIGVGKLWTDHEKIKQAGALWDGIVCTFLVAPAIFGKLSHAPFDFDAFGILITAANFEDWHLEIIRVDEYLN